MSDDGTIPASIDGRAVARYLAELHAQCRRAAEDQERHAAAGRGEARLCAELREVVAMAQHAGACEALAVACGVDAAEALSQAGLRELAVRRRADRARREPDGGADKVFWDHQPGRGVLIVVLDESGDGPGRDRGAA